MNMDIILTRNIQVKSYQALMKLGLASNEHKFYIRVLELAHEAGYINQRIINEKLLFRNAEHVMGKRILELLERLELIERIETFSYETTRNWINLRAIFFRNYQRQEDYDVLKLLQSVGYYETVNPGKYLDKFQGTEAGRFFFEGDWPREAKSQEEETFFEKLVKLGFLVRTEAKNVQKLLNFNYKLTDNGKYTIDEGIVRIPEEGYFTIHTTEDTLISERIIGYDRPADDISTEFNEVTKKNKNPMEKQHDNFVSPAWVKSLQKEIFKKPPIIRLVAQNFDEIQVYGIGDKLLATKTRFIVSISLKASVYGNIELKMRSSKSENKEITIKHSLNLKYKNVLASLLKEAYEDIIFINNEPTLLVTYNELKQTEKNSFLKRIFIEKPKIEMYGEFNDCYLNNLRISPKTVEDAALWVKWLIEEQIRYYLDESEYIKIRNECIAKFQERFQLTEIIPMVPTFEEFLHDFTNRREKNSSKYWYVAAPHFLTMRR